MNILYIHQYFKTPREPGATRIYFIVRKLIDSGYNVTVITQNKQAKVDREEVNIDGINIVYLKNSYSNEMSIPSRIKSFFNFMFKASIEALKQKNIDLVIATSTPLSVGLPALILKKIRKIPYIFEVRDLWPEVPIQMGGLKNPIAQSISKWFERTIYKNAVHLVSLSPGMYEGIIKYVPKEKVSMIPNMSKIDHFWPRTRDHQLLQKMNLRATSFKVIHFGTMGIANGLQFFMEAAKFAQLQGIEDLDFILLGEGKAEKILQKFAQENNLNNTFFFSRVPLQEVSEIVNFCDVSVVSFLDIPILSTNSPNKLFDSLAAGKPIIVNSNGWTRKMVEDNNCGAYIPFESPQLMIDLIQDWRNKPEILVTMSRNSRVLAENKYNSEILTTRFVTEVNKIFKSVN